MPDHRTVLIPCRFTRGGFAHERVFWIKTPDETGEYRGLSYIGYCFGRDHAPLPDGEPPDGESVEGFVSARVIDGTSYPMTVQVPDGELCDIDTAIAEDPDHVSVRS